MKAFRFTHIDHCSVLITDVEKSRQFYGGTLGLTEIAPPKEFDFVAVWYDLGGTYLHLLLKPHPDTISPRHFCLHVTDARAARGSVLQPLPGQPPAPPPPPGFCSRLRQR